MPKAAREFVIGNRMVMEGEEFQIPAGEEKEWENSPLIAKEGEQQPAEAPQVGTETPPLGDVQPPAGVEPGAQETQEDLQNRTGGSDTQQGGGEPVPAADGQE